MSINRARFKINNTASEDPSTGKRGFDATASQVLTVTLEQNPARVLSVKYELPNASIAEAPAASLYNTQQLFTEGGLSSVLLTSPNDSVHITVNPATTISSYVLRCTAVDDTGTHIFERMIVVRENGLRMTVPAERQEYEPLGWSNALNEITKALATLIP